MMDGHQAGVVPPRQAVLFVSPYSPLAVGGVAQFLIDVGILLIRDEVPVGYLHVEELAEMSLPPSLASATRREISTKGPRGLRIALVVLRTLRGMVQFRGGFTICHALVPQPLTAAAIAIARVLGLKTIVTVFAPFPKDPNPLAEAGQRIAERVTLLLAHEVVYECEATQRSFPRKGVVIYNGVDTTIYRPSEDRRREIRSRLEIPEGTVVFLYAGRITQLKGIQDLVAAYGGLDPTALRDSTLLLVGPIESMDPDTFLRRGTPIADRIRHVGPVDKYRLIDYYQAADVFVLPSYWEGISSALVEAMACGLPAIVSSAGGSPEVVVEGQTGFTHRPGNVEELRARLKELIERPDLRSSMSLAARKRIENVFEIHSMTRRYRKVYEKVLGSTATSITLTR